MIATIALYDFPSGLRMREHAGRKAKAPGANAAKQRDASASQNRDLKTVLSHTPFLLTRCSSDLRYLLVSESYARMIGRDVDDVVGRPIAEMMTEDGFQTILPYVRKVLQGHRVEYEAQVNFEGVGSRFLRVIYVPERDSRGEVQGWIASIVDLTDQKLAEGRIAADLRAMTILREVGIACAREGLKKNQCLLLILEAAIEIAGADKGNVQLFDAESGALVIAVQRGFDEPFLKFFERTRDDSAACTVALQSGKQIVVEDVLESDIFIGQPSQKVLIQAGLRAVISTPLMSSRNNVLGMISTHFAQPYRPAERELHLLDLLSLQAADYLERKHAEEIQKTLIREVQHRSNNLLAMVQSIAQRSLAGARSLPEARAAFEGRLLALARANRELVELNWAGVSLSQILKLNLAPFAGRSTIDGADTRLSPKDGQHFSLAVHELVTNAAKYGALSNQNGKVRVAWKIRRDGDKQQLHFTWQEIGGPSVVTPHREGFGTLLLRTVFPDARLDFQPHGLTCEISLLLGKEGSLSFSAVQKLQDPA